MSFTSRLIVAQQSHALKDQLWQLVREAKGDDIMAPVTVIGPTRYANLSLRYELGRQGFINVRFIVFPVLSEMLGAASLARAGRRPLTSVLERVTLQEMLSRCTGPLEPVRDHPSTLASVRASFRELRRASDNVLDALKAQGGLRSELVELFRSFREQTVSERYDVDGLVTSAAEAALDGETQVLDDLGPIIFYLPKDIGGPEERLIETLARQDRCALLLGRTGDSDADRPAIALAETLRPAFTSFDIDESAGDEQPLFTGKADLHISPNAHEELRWVIREVIREATEHEIPFHRMAVVYRTEDPYASLIRDELKLAGIPTAGPGRETLASTGVGRTLLGLLDLSQGGFRRGDVMSWLAGCPVDPPFGRTPRINPSHWDTISRRAGIVGGLEQWRDRLTAFSTKLTEDAERREKAEEISSARASGMRAEARAALNALAFVEQLADDTRPPAEGSSWETFSAWASGLLEKYLSHDLPPAEAMARDHVLRSLEELRAADSISPSTTLDVFRKTVDESLRSSIGHLGVTGQGVFVSSFSAAAGMSFDIVWMVGMVEGGTPPAVRPDPLLPEHDWTSAGGESRASARVASERYDYLSAVSSAPRRWLSYPVADGSSQREAYPSRWFLEQATVLEGSPVRTDNLPKMTGRPWLTLDESAEQALKKSAAGVSADLHDYHLLHLLNWRDSGNSPRRHPLARKGTLAGAANLGRSRGVRRLTEFDGNVSGVVDNSEFADQLTKTPVSATSLEAWATCPFRYFLGHVLRLSALETPEETTSINALDRGLLVHDILERFIREADAAGGIPTPGSPWNDRGRNMLRNIATDEFKKAEAKGITGKPLLWSLAQQDILDDLDTFIEQDAHLRARHGTASQFVELSFGFTEETPPVIDPETGVGFRGFIDRVDLDSSGGSALVIDYKTGSASPYDALQKDIIDRGKRLQLGVYSLAARQLFPGAADVRAAYWFTTTHGGFRFAPPEHFNISDDEVRERFRQGVTTAVAGIKGGVFPANPGPPDRGSNANCRFCDFDQVCPSRRADLWERKKSDGLLADYLSLSEEPEKE